jgi:hypothetical protein
VPLPAKLERRPQNIAGVSNLFAGIAECLLMAQSGHPDRVGECPLSGAKRTPKFKSVTSAFDPLRKSRMQTAYGLARIL